MPDPSRTFTVTLGPSGLLESVNLADGKATVERIPVPNPFPPGKLTAASAIAIVMTQENPTCYYWVQGGQAFRVCS